MPALTFNAALEQVALRRFKERVEVLRAQIGAGAMTHETYKLNCGIVKGLQEAEEILADALKEIQQAARGA